MSFLVPSGGIALIRPFSAIAQETQPVEPYLDIRWLMITKKTDAA
jgi:hypothetical protein